MTHYKTQAERAACQIIQYENYLEMERLKVQTLQEQLSAVDLGLSFLLLCFKCNIATCLAKRLSTS